MDQAKEVTENSAEPSMPAPRNADGPVGAVLVIFSFVGLLLAVLFLTSLEMLLGLLTSASPEALTGSQPLVRSTASPGAIPLVAFLLPLLLCVLMCLTGIWIRQSERRGFGIAILLGALACPFGLGGAALGVSLMVYSVLRLNGRLGQEPI